MNTEIHTHIVERPEGLDYPVRFKQIYGFANNDCEDAIKSFTDVGFKIIYSAKTPIRIENGDAERFAQGVNAILEKSNEIGELDKDSLDKLLK